MRRASATLPSALCLSGVPASLRHGAACASARGVMVFCYVCVACDLEGRGRFLVGECKLDTNVKPAAHKSSKGMAAGRALGEPRA